MTNRERIEEKIAAVGLKMGCYCNGNRIEKIPDEGMNRVIDAIKYGVTIDVPVRIGGGKYIVEIVSEGIEPEVDFSCLSARDCISKYGTGDKRVLDRLDW